MLITEGKTNWKYITIIVILAVMVSGGVLWLSTQQEVPITELPEIKKTDKVIDKKYCQQDNDCVFLTFRCCSNPNPCQKEPAEVINKDYKEEIEKDLESKCPPSCPQYSPPLCSKCLNVENFFPVCLNNKCEVKKEINCETYCQTIAKEKLETCPWISNESLITKENTEKCQCAKFQKAP